jgi:hypothetical protein
MCNVIWTTKIDNFLVKIVHEIKYKKIIISIVVNELVTLIIFCQKNLNSIFRVANLRDNSIFYVKKLNVVLSIWWLIS